MQNDEMFEDGDGAFVNWDDVPEVNDNPVPDGTYNAVLTSCEYKLSKSSGQPMWSCEFTIVGSDYDGRKIYENFSFSDAAKPYTRKKLAQLDPGILAIKPFNLQTIPETLVGKNTKIKIKVKEETYEGETRKKANIQRFAPAGDAFLDN